MLDVLQSIMEWAVFVVLVLAAAFWVLLLIGTPLLLILIRCLHAVADHRSLNTPPSRPRLSPPTACPHCHRAAFHTAGAALCDGFDADGKRIGWGEQYGRCTACGMRLMQVIGQPWQLMSAAEWDDRPHRRLAAERANVPPGFFPPPIRDAVLLLDDRDDRFTAFRNALEPELQIVWWRSAHRMIEELPEFLRFARLICLDHDLYAADGEPDPGDGLDVVHALATRRPTCPVIVHSSNGDRAALMADELRLAGWDCRLVAPFGNDWVRRDWLTAVRELTPLETTAPPAGYAAAHA